MSLNSKFTRPDPQYQRLQRELERWATSGVPRKFRPTIDVVNATYRKSVGSPRTANAAPPPGEEVVWGSSAAVRRPVSAARAPRRATRPIASHRSAAASATATASGADPPPEPPSPRAVASVAPVVVTDAPAMAAVLAAAVGLTPRQLRELVAERGIRHARPGRHVYVRVDDLLAALGLSGAPSALPPSTDLSEDDVVALAAGEDDQR